MNIQGKILMIAVVALMALGSVAYAETTVITTTTTVTPQEIENADKVSLMAFDYNEDGVLSMEEVGEKLFYIFDRDGNEIIDNLEFDRNSMMTITPMEKETVVMVDYYGDGVIEQVTHTYEHFMEESQLIRFADDHDGLSPREFINTSFLILDDNGDKAIELDEWKEAYVEMVIPKNAEQERYN